MEDGFANYNYQRASGASVSKAVGVAAGAYLSRTSGVANIKEAITGIQMYGDNGNLYVSSFGSSASRVFHALSGALTLTSTFAPIFSLEEELPLGFVSAAQFERSSSELGEILKASGITDANIGVRGSSVTGFSYMTGKPFGPGSDIDFFVESAQLTDGLKTSGNIPGFVHPNRIMRAFPELRAWSENWSAELGRPVTPAGFVPGTLPNQPVIWAH